MVTGRGADRSDWAERWVVVGGAGFLGQATASRLLGLGADVAIVDVREPRRDLVAGGATWIPLDLAVDPVVLPPGRVIYTAATGNPAPARPRTAVLDSVFPASRLARAL